MPDLRPWLLQTGSSRETAPFTVSHIRHVRKSHSAVPVAHRYDGVYSTQGGCREEILRTDQAQYLIGAALPYETQLGTNVQPAG